MCPLVFGGLLVGPELIARAMTFEMRVPRREAITYNENVDK